MRLRSLAFWLVVLPCIFAASSTAQEINVSSINVAQTPLPGSGHDYIKMLQETVNPANGSLSLRIEAPVPMQRGDVNYPYYIFGYDSSGVSLPGGGLFYSEAPAGVYTPSFSFSWTDNSFINTGPGVGPSAVGLIPGGFIANAGVGQTFVQGVSYSQQLGDPPITEYCVYYTGYVYVDPQETRHNLGLQWVNYNYNGNQPSACTAVTVPTGGDWQYQAALPASGTSFYPYITDSHGRSGSLEDTNGNCCGAVGQKTIVSNQVTAVAIPGLTNPYSITYGTQSRSYQPGSKPLVINGAPACAVIPKETSTKTVVNTITLPESNLHYTFGYQSPYALLNSITYPTGATVTYTWTPQPLAESLGVGPGNAHCDYQHDWPYITQRIVSFDGSATALEQDFAYTTQWGTGNSADQWTTKTTTVTTKDWKRPGTPSFQTVYTYAPIAQIDPFTSTYLGQVAVESQIVYHDWNGAVLETVTKNWYTGSQTPVLLSQCVTLPSGSTSGKFYAYGPLDVVTDVKEYNYGILSSTACAQGASAPTATPTRETKMTPATFSTPTPLYPSGPSIFDRPSTVQVYGNGTLVAETDYTYDSYGAGLTSATAYGHDDTNFPVTYTNRGNATTISRKCLQSCANAVSTYTFDETGQILSITDPCGNGTCSDITGSGHTTTYSYADSYSSGTPPGNTNTFITQITRPTTASGIKHVSNYSYSYPGGQLTVAKDENGLSTDYAYVDPFARLTGITYPDGGQTSIAYDDAGPTPTVTTSKLITSGRSATTVTVKDGMGHQIGTQLTTDPEGTVYTATVPDGLGHTYTTSNPYRSTSDLTYGITTYAYDALGRACLVVPPDGTLPTAGPPCPSSQPNNTVLTTYSSNQTTVTDQAGITRTSQTDGLGRLTEVWEAPANGNFTTIYTYDALDDLSSVAQGSFQNRTFHYDSLKRLTSANNPESGTVAYAYDANSNVVTKTDAVGRIQTYAYDSLNRVLSETPTPSDFSSKRYVYDSAACLGVPRCADIGQLVATYDFQGDENITYDPLDRQVSIVRNTLGITKTATYAYNYDHSVASILYPSGRTVTYTTDTAGRPSDAQDVANSIAYIKGFCNNGTGTTGACYAPQGAVTAWTYGANTGSYVAHEASFNSRLQPMATNVFVAGNSTPLMELIYNFVDANGHNNGNVIGISNYNDSTRSQRFTYDQLNRIATAESISTYATSPAHCWGESYSYDNAAAPAIGEYGNLTSIGVASTAYNGCTQESLSVTANSKNQITTFAYDASGNTLNDLTSGCITGQVCYAWLADGHLAAANGTYYYYDVHGNRVQKAGSKFYWYGLGSEPLDESDTSGNITDEYVYFGTKRVAHRAASSNTIYFYGQDMLGTSRTVFTSAGVSCYDADFYPFGGERSYTDTCPPNYKFTGKERDAESNLDNFGARYNASQIGRFISPDPLLSSARLTNPQTWNRYTYALNNPLRILDPTGLWDWDASAGGDMSDEDLFAMASSRQNKRRQWAQKALYFRAEFRAARDSADEAAGSSTLSDDQQSAAQTAVDSYGSEGDGNGVLVGIENGHGASTILNDDDTISVKFGSSLTGDFLAATIGHEGAHVDQADAWLDGGESSIGNLSHNAREQAAWAVGSSIAEALGMKSYGPFGGGQELQAWNRGWKAADIATLRSKGIANILNYMRDHSSAADMQKTYTDEHHHQD